MSNRWPLMLALALALPSCGSGGEQAEAVGEPADDRAAAAPADPCALLGKEEVAAVIGEPVVAASPGGEGCTYETEDAMASSVKVEVKRSGGAAEMQAAREATGVIDRMGAGLKEGGGAQADAGAALAGAGELKGLGDQAFFGANEQLHVLKKDAYFSVTPPAMRSRMSGGNPLLSAEKKREMARALAGKIAAKL